MNLVAQGPNLGQAQVDELSRLVKRSPEPIAERAVRFRDCQADRNISQWCEEHRVDHAFVPEERRLADLKLLAMDMDSTLVTIEGIDEMGDMLGIKPEIAAVTAQAMRGEIDYTESLRRRVALLAGLQEAALERICEERMHLSPGAEALIARCRALGIRTLLVSGGFGFFTRWLQPRLGLDAVLANELEIRDGRLTGRVIGNIVDGRAKAGRVLEEMQALGIPRERVLAIGDGANDIPMMAAAGVSVAWHAKPAVRAHATHALDYAGLDGVLHLFA